MQVFVQFYPADYQPHSAPLRPSPPHSAPLQPLPHPTPPPTHLPTSALSMTYTTRLGSLAEPCSPQQPGARSWPGTDRKIVQTKTSTWDESCAAWGRLSKEKTHPPSSSINISQPPNCLAARWGCTLCHGNHRSSTEHLVCAIRERHQEHVCEKPGDLHC